MSDVTLETTTNGQIIFADHATDWAGGAVGTSLELGTPTEVQIDMTDVADDTARQSVQVDLGANRAPRYSVGAVVEMAATPTTGERIDLFLAWSPDSVAANGNPGYATGADAAYAGGVGTLDEGLAQLVFAGSLITSADATGTVQVQIVGVVVPQERFVSLIVVNRSGAAFHSDAVETHFVLTPVTDDIA